MRAVGSRAARAAAAAVTRPSLRPSNGIAAASAAAAQAALKARLAAREVRVEPAPSAHPVVEALPRTERRGGAAPRQPPCTRATAAAPSSAAPDTNAKTLLQQPLHRLNLLLLLTGERTEETGNLAPCRASTSIAAVAAAAAAAAKSTALAARAAAARAAAAPSHAAPVVAGQGAAGGLDGQEATRGLAQPPLAAVPRLFPCRGGGTGRDRAARRAGDPPRRREQGRQPPTAAAEVPHQAAKRAQARGRQGAPEEEAANHSAWR